MTVAVTNSQAQDAPDKIVIWPTKVEFDIYGTTRTTDFDKSYGGLGLGATVWGNIFNDSYGNIGAEIQGGGESTKQELVDTLAGFMKIRFAHNERVSFFLKAGFGSHLEKDQNFLQGGGGLRYYWSKRISTAVGAYGRKPIQGKSDWEAIGEASIGLGF